MILCKNKIKKINKTPPKTHDSQTLYLNIIVFGTDTFSLSHLMSVVALERQCVMAPLCGSERRALWITPLAAMNGTLLSHSITQFTPPPWQDKPWAQAVAEPPVTRKNVTR